MRTNLPRLSVFVLSIVFRNLTPYPRPFAFNAGFSASTEALQNFLINLARRCPLDTFGGFLIVITPRHPSQDDGSKSHDEEFSPRREPTCRLQVGGLLLSIDIAAQASITRRTRTLLGLTSSLAYFTWLRTRFRKLSKRSG
jgi:hypothetical protein